MSEPYSTEPVTLMEEVLPPDTNAYGTLFGGRLLSMMDKAAGIVASKFARREFVTVSIDTLTFELPARLGDLVEIEAKVVFTSTHSAGCLVTATRMTKADWNEERICRGYFFMVAIDSQGRPIPIPQLTPDNEQQQQLWDEAESIRTDLLSRTR